MVFSRNFVPTTCFPRNNEIREVLREMRCANEAKSTKMFRKIKIF